MSKLSENEKLKKANSATQTDYGDENYGSGQADVKPNHSMPIGQRPNEPELHQQGKKPLSEVIEDLRVDVNKLTHAAEALHRNIVGNNRPRGSEKLNGNSVRNILINLRGEIEYAKNIIEEINNDM